MESHGRSSLNQWIIAIWVNLPLLFYGLLAGWMSPMGVFLQSDRSPSGQPISDDVISWMASLNSLSAIFAVPFFSWLADRFGRKISIIFLSLPAGVSWVLKFHPSSTALLLLARFIFGISAGGCFVISPTYVREISEDRLRGTLGSLLMIFQNVGILLMYIMGSVLDYYTILWIVTPLPFIHSFVSLWLPETPCFSIKQRNIEQAKRSLAWLRKLDPEDKILLHEIEMMKQEESENLSARKITACSICNDAPKRKAFIISLVCIFMQAAGGGFAVITYAGTILGGSTMDANVEAIAIAVVLIAGAVLSLSVVEKFGRKPLLILSTGSMSVALFTLAMALTLRQLSYFIPEWLTIASLTLAIFSYAFGTSPLPFIIMSELFSFQHRARLTGVVTMQAWALTFILLLSFKTLVSILGLNWIFFGFTAVNLFGLIFAVIYIPETKGKSLQQIELELVNKHKDIDL